MSLESAQLNMLEDVQANFEDAIERGDEREARIIVGQLMELGYEQIAKDFSQKLNESYIKEEIK